MSAAPAPASSTSTAPVRATATKLYDQAKQNPYVQYGVSKLASISSAVIPTEVVNRAAAAAPTVSAYLDRSVTAVDNTLVSTLAVANNVKQQATAKVSATIAVANNYKQQATAKATATTTQATAVVSNNLAAIRERLAAERAARATQVAAAAGRIQQAVEHVVEANPVLSSTVNTTKTAVNQTINYAADTWKSSLTTAQAKIDYVLPAESEVAANNAAETNAANPGAPSTLSSIASTVVRRVRSRSTRAANKTVAQISAVRNNVRNRIDVQLHVLASTPQFQQLQQHLSAAIPQQFVAQVQSLPALTKQQLQQLRSIKIQLSPQQVQQLLATLPKQLQQQTEQVKTFATQRVSTLSSSINNQYTTLTTSTLPHARVWATAKVNDGKEVVRGLQTTYQKEGVSATVKQLTEQAKKQAEQLTAEAKKQAGPTVTVVSTHVANVRGLVYANIQFAIDWSKAHGLDVKKLPLANYYINGAAEAKADSPSASAATA